MIDLNKNIITIINNPEIIFKLKKIKITKLGHLVMTSYPELLYTHIFKNKELDIIKQNLTSKGLNYINEIQINDKLQKDLLKFSFEEYQKFISKCHHKKYNPSKIAHLRYTDPLKTVKYLTFMYEQLYNTPITPDIKILLTEMLTRYSYTTIADFVDIKPNSIDINVINLIAKILGTPLNSNFSHNQKVKRENQIFNHENVESATINAYIQNFSSDTNIATFINNSKSKTLIKH